MTHSTKLHAGQVVVGDNDLSDWLALRFSEQAHQLKANAKRQTWRLEYHGQPMLVKWYRLPAKAPWSWVKHHNPACHVAKVTDAFGKVGIRTVGITGVKVQSRPEKAAVLAMEWLQHADILHNFAHDPELENMLRQGLLDDIMRQMALMHRLGWVHGDLKWGNILIRDQSAWFIDLDGVHRKRPGRNGMRDLARFMVDCDEAQCSDALKQQAMQSYADHAGIALAKLQSDMERDYRKIHRRHQARYDGSRNMPRWPTDAS